MDGGANYRSPHWDEPNVLAHVRFNDRVTDGKKTLFIEEVQSDWHQAGKRKGYHSEKHTGRSSAEIDRDMDAILATAEREGGDATAFWDRHHSPTIATLAAARRATNSHSD
jgi:hypothetical protein